MKRYRLFKRIANTEDWAYTGQESDDPDDAMTLGRGILGGESTGVNRIDTTLGPYDERRVVLVIGV